MVAEKEKTQRTNKKHDNRQDLYLGASAYRADALPTELRCQLVQPEFNTYTSSNHSAAIFLSCGLFKRHIFFLLTVFFLWMSTVDSIYLV